MKERVGKAMHSMGWPGISKYPAVSKLYDKVQLRLLERSLVRHRYDLEGYYSVLKHFTPHGLHKIYLNQIWSEWKQLMDYLVSEHNPKRILEIGAGRGGSTYFFSRLFGTGLSLITIDADARSREYVALIQRKSQKLCYINADSHDPTTVQTVEAVLDGGSLDILYIDGDHSYEGVKRDFDLYSRFCSKSLICFHDIIPDYGSSKGIQTDRYSGDVYKFWNEVRSQYQYKEFVDSPQQDAFGIGVLFYNQGPQPPDAFEA